MFEIRKKIGERRLFFIGGQDDTPVRIHHVALSLPGKSRDIERFVDGSVVVAGSYRAVRKSPVRILCSRDRKKSQHIAVRLRHVQHDVLLFTLQSLQLRLAGKLAVLAVQRHVFARVLEKVDLGVAPAGLVRLEIFVQPVLRQRVQPVSQVLVPVHQHVPVGGGKGGEGLVDLRVDLRQVTPAFLV